MDEKRILGAVFSLTLTGSPPTIDELSERIGIEGAILRRRTDACENRGLLKREGRHIMLTAKGRRRIKVVFIGGGFEVIHRGHLYTISKAKGLGDVLVAVLARDSTIRARKGREPVADETQRLMLLSSLRQVDVAILGVRGNIYDTLEKVKPDIVALGYDQHHLEADIEREGTKRGIAVKVVRLDSPDPRLKTTSLLKDL